MTIVYAILALSILIFVHELGHFWAARGVGVRVLKFSIGFGPRVLGFKRGETEWVISLLPFGGFVKMAGEQEGDDEIKGEPWEFAMKPVWARTVIIVAGVTMNWVLAAVLYSLLAWRVGAATIPTRTVGGVAEGSPAAEAGLLPGDELVSVDGISIDRWDTYLEEVDPTAGPLAFVVRRDGKTITREVTPRWLDDVGSWQIGLEPEAGTELGLVKKGGPADRAGLRPGDRVTALNGIEVERWKQIETTIYQSPDEVVLVEWARDGRTLSAEIVPEQGELPQADGTMREVGLIGIQPAYHFEPIGPVAAVGAGIGRTVDLSVTVVKFFGRLFTGGVSREMVGGPIRIVQMAGGAASWGVAHFASFLALLSVHLAVLNLLPIPVLDGGHLVFLAIEAVARRPLSIKQRTVLTQLGLLLLVVLMITVTAFDVQRLFR
jgi:regulator of sigma E protease